MKHFIRVIICLSISFNAIAQRPILNKGLLKGKGNKGEESTNQNTNNQSAGNSSGPRYDTLGFEHRNDAKDSMKILFRFIGSSKYVHLDSSIDNFDKYFSVPSSYNYLGNNGAAAVSIVYTPNNIIGFDPGFHAYDLYRFTFENTKLYHTTKPFTSICYQLASGKEQMLKTIYTQNINPSTNFGFDYQLISSPGFFVTQNNNHNSYRLFTTFQDKRKRYNLEAVVFGNNVRAAENGGIENDSDLLDPNRKQRFSVPVHLGGAAPYANNPFVTSIATGNHYKDFNYSIKQTYDFGTKTVKLINDTTREHYFYPKVRVQYSFVSSKKSYHFSDANPDSGIYKKWYDVVLSQPLDTFNLQEKWTMIKHDVSISHFPSSKNLNQFFLLGININKIKREEDPNHFSFQNQSLYAQYSNTTKNTIWDLQLKGEYLFSGFNSGDYSFQANLQKVLNNRLGDVQLFFKNVRRSPSFIFNNTSFFNLTERQDFKKEQLISFGIKSDNPLLNISLKNHLIKYHSYFTSYFQTAQYGSTINVVQLSLNKRFKLSKRWFWYMDYTMQHTDEASPIKLPLIFTKNKIAYEGTFFKNLILSTGIEARYYSAFQNYGYSPLNGQFFVQDSVKIHNLPDVHIFTHFRIKSFAGYIRAENLNTAHWDNGLSWVNNNFAAPQYPTQGFMIRFGIQWWFVN